MTLRRHEAIFRFMNVTNALAVAFSLLVILSCMPTVGAAEFDINGPTIELRKIQFCSHCNSPLVVTNVPEGAAIRCPSCNTVQRRLTEKYLITKMYQVCPRCGSRMDVSEFKPMSRIRCGSCGFFQEVLPGAVYRKKDNDAEGKLPDAPAVPGELPPPPPPPSSEMPKSGDFAGKQSRDDVNGGLNTAVKDFLPQGAPVKDPEPLTTVKAPSESDFSNGVGRGEADLQTGNGGVVAKANDSWIDNSEKNGLRIAAVVNGQAIPKADVEAALTAAMEKVRLQMGRRCFTPLGLAALRKKEAELQPVVLKKLVDRALIMESAAVESALPDSGQVLLQADQLREIDTSGVEPSKIIGRARYELALTEMKRRHGTPRRKVSPEEAREYYTRNRNLYMQPAKVNIRSLVIFNDRTGRQDSRSAKMIASEIETKIRAGVDFAALVRQYSEGPFASDGGVLRIEKEELVPLPFLAYQIQDTITQNPERKIIGPLELVSSVVFCQMESYRAPEPLPFAEVSRQIEGRLENDLRRQAFEEWLDEVRENAHVVIY